MIQKTKKVTFTNANLDDNFRFVYDFRFGTTEIGVKWYDENLVERLTADAFQIISQDQVILGCGGEVFGTQTLIFSYAIADPSVIPITDLILPFTSQQLIKPMSINNQAKYELLAREVESFELDKLLGYSFYQDVAENQEVYTDLLNGVNFLDIYQRTVSHRGLRYVLAYLNYAKYIGESYVFDTFTGFVQKTRPDSERISTGDIKRLQLENREIAFNSFELIRMYINSNKTLYPLWGNRSDKKTTLPKFYGIKKTWL